MTASPFATPVSLPLLVAATARELAAGEGWRSLCCGVGPVEAAAATARALAEHRPSFVLHVGIAGARTSAALRPGSLVIGTASVYHDLMELPAEWGRRHLSANAALLEAAARALPDAVFLPIGTSGRIGGTISSPAADGPPPECVVEAMEGFAVLRAAELAGIPALEVRAISNAIEETDRSRWHFEAAFAAITAAIPPLITALNSVAAAHGSEGRHA